MSPRKVFFVALAGGLIGGLLAGSLLRPAGAWAYSALLGDKLQIVNNDGKTVTDIFVPPGGGGVMDFYTERGELRLQLGTYSTGSEKGQPLVGLSDNNSHLRFLIRLAGANESPVLVFKDKAGRDRMLMGLDMSGAGSEPFLKTYDSAGKEKVIFGN